ncbi:MAG TPA: Flp family type IVb pilin [Gemmataceae bacterium]|nr:Flp family type IVb pilin [Gemmataceae bacterium]
MRFVAKMYLTARNLFTKKEEGASLVEYGLLVALIAVVCIAAVTALGTSIKAVFEDIAGKI